ncbi:MAG: anthranilate synthase component I family protein, partial [Bryobacterales bacterium]|nr:anthranilate synthase component I family protein [Bryobacterales bacterium]
MWSDRIPPERLRGLIEGLQSVLPAHGGEPFQYSGFALLGRNQLYQNPLATVSYWGGYAIASGSGGVRKLPACGFDLLQAMLDAWREYAGARLVGFLSYDLAAELEDIGPVPAEAFHFPKFHFGLYRGWTGPVVEHAQAGWQPAAGSQPAPLAGTAFEASVERIVAQIHAGDLFQTNLCRCIEAPLPPGAEWDLFQRMRSINPAQYEAFIMVDEDHAIMSISPELFLKVTNRVVESAPIKGTRPRGNIPEEDQALLNSLLASEKDRAELAMIVDVTRNDLARVCEPGSVEVVEHAAHLSLPTVHHLFSTVRGRLRRECGSVDLLRAAFPAASISGAPKIEAMRVAFREEGQWRGPCMGA